MAGSSQAYQIFWLEDESDFMNKIIAQWKVDGVLIHLNRGCEVRSSAGESPAIAETGVPVMT
jgi:benzoyl-CoA reductase subunit B